MLIFKRKPGEKLVIGGTIVLTVVRGKDGHLRLGVDAPRSVPVLREELLSRDEVAEIEARAKEGGR